MDFRLLAAGLKKSEQMGGNRKSWVSNSTLYSTSGTPKAQALFGEIHKHEINVNEQRGATLPAHKQVRINQKDTTTKTVFERKT